MKKRRKPTDKRLLDLVDEGLTYAEIGDRYGISKQAVFKRARKLKGVMTAATCTEGARQLVEHRLDVMGQLKDINVRSLVLLETAESEQDREGALKAIGEIRQQLKLAGDLMAMVADLRAVEEFQKTVLTCIAEEAPNVQEKIVARLNREHALRSAVGYRVRTAKY